MLYEAKKKNVLLPCDKPLVVMRDNICISFQTLRKDRKYLNVFLKLLDEEGIEYTVGDLEERKLPDILLQPFDN
ncbi:MAG: hypothetical protein K6F99_10735 [Lachnospiraceae bacterium]|nr:hypothetical protein [Lachnospiraceae bacterium]